MTSAFDYDGMMLCTLDLSGRGSLDRLDLVIPVKDSTAPLAHICGERCRVNFAGCVPKGTGVVWDSTAMHLELFYTKFVPWCWFGNDDCGWSYYAHNDKGWILDRDGSAMQLERDKAGDET